MVFKRPLLILIMFTLCSGYQIMAQDSTIFKTKEDSLLRLSNSIWKSRTDTLKIRLNNQFVKSFASVLESPGSFNYPFDSLKGISKLHSDDGAFRIFTWNIPMMDNSSLYSGFIQFNDGKLIPLHSTGRNLADLGNEILAAGSWYGAIYYTLITGKYEGKTYYTLLGWNGNDASSNMKVIDILHIDSDRNPQFGAAVFKTRDGVRNRVVIEYAENGNAALRYDFQSIVIQKGRRVKEKKSWMIVMDRLIPMAAGLEGMRKYYVPAGDVYDGYLFLDGFWTFVEEVKVGNPEPNGKVKE